MVDSETDGPKDRYPEFFSQLKQYLDLHWDTEQETGLAFMKRVATAVRDPTNGGNEAEEKARFEKWLKRQDGERIRNAIEYFEHEFNSAN